MSISMSRALAGLARLDRRPGIAAFDQRRRRIEPQPRLLPQRTVARIAPRRENRLDLRDVIHVLAGRRLLNQRSHKR